MNWRILLACNLFLLTILSLAYDVSSSSSLHGEWMISDNWVIGTYWTFPQRREISQETPGGPQGGDRPKSPLEELGVPKFFPSWGAPPEAQYGTIGLIVIMVGAVFYYLRRPKTTQQLYKENTAPRVKYGPRKPSKKRGVHSKEEKGRRVHSKKEQRGPFKRSEK